MRQDTSPVTVHGNDTENDRRILNSKITMIDVDWYRLVFRRCINLDLSKFGSRKRLINNSKLMFHRNF